MGFGSWGGRTIEQEQGWWWWWCNKAATVYMHLYASTTVLHLLLLLQAVVDFFVFCCIASLFLLPFTPACLPLLCQCWLHEQRCSSQAEESNSFGSIFLSVSFWGDPQPFVLSSTTCFTSFRFLCRSVYHYAVQSQCTIFSAFLSNYY